MFSTAKCHWIGMRKTRPRETLPDITLRPRGSATGGVRRLSGPLGLSVICRCFEVTPPSGTTLRFLTPYCAECPFVYL
jgi:hypothetical protein